MKKIKYKEICTTNNNSPNKNLPRKFKIEIKGKACVIPSKNLCINSYQYHPLTRHKILTVVTPVTKVDRRDRQSTICPLHTPHKELLIEISFDYQFIRGSEFPGNYLSKSLAGSLSYNIE